MYAHGTELETALLVAFGLDMSRESVRVHAQLLDGGVKFTFTIFNEQNADGFFPMETIKSRFHIRQEISMGCC